MNHLKITKRYAARYVCRLWKSAIFSVGQFQPISLIFKTQFYIFHSCTVHLDNIKVFYLPTDAQ